MDDNLYRKINGKYVPVGKFDWHGFPCDGIWLVKYDQHEKSASCISRLHDLPDPYPFYRMILDRETIASWLIKIFNGESISLQESADKLIIFLSELNKKENKWELNKPQKPLFKIEERQKTNIKKKNEKI
jgi:hypothetical protein